MLIIVSSPRITHRVIKIRMRDVLRTEGQFERQANHGVAQAEREVDCEGHEDAHSDVRTEC